LLGEVLRNHRGRRRRAARAVERCRRRERRLPLHDRRRLPGVDVQLEQLLGGRRVRGEVASCLDSSRRPHERVDSLGGGWMTTDTLRTICRSLPAVTEDVKWGSDLCFSVAKKMFVVVNLEPPHQVAFKCTAESFAELVERDGIIPAPYMA